MSVHVSLFHSAAGAAPTYTLGKPVQLEQEMFCCCGFSTNSGHRLAKHLGTHGCRSAYPSREEAVRARAEGDWEEGEEMEEGADKEMANTKDGESEAEANRKSSESEEKADHEKKDEEESMETEKTAELSTPPPQEDMDTA
jgi:hypothetical protein